MPGPPREFHGRMLLKVILGLGAAVVVALLAFGVGISLVRGEPEGVLVLGLPCLGMLAYLAVLANRTFSTLRIDARGVDVLRRWRSIRVPWAEVETLFYWTVVQHAHHGSAVEPFVVLMGADRRRRLTLKSTWEPEAFDILLEAARAAGVRIENRAP